jgi:hypothetical protein
MTWKTHLLAGAVWAGVMLGCGTAFGQGEGVLERARPDYDAIGIPVGALRLYPVLDLDVAYDDNIYRTSTATTGDYFFQLAPRASLRSQWSRHALILSGGVNFLQYSQYDSEDQTNWDIGADGRLDVLGASFVTGNLSYRQTHEGRFSADSPGNVAEPIPFSIFHAATEINIKPNRLGLAVGATLDQLDFDSAPITGGGVMNNDDRDRSRYQVSARASYDFSPGYAAFVDATFDTRDYRLAIDRSGVNRDSEGYRIDGGLAMTVTRLVRGELFAGYLHRDYELPLGDISGFDYGVDLTWYATELMTVRLAAIHEINDTTLEEASGSKDRIFSAGLDYEVLRNVIAQGNLSYTNSDFHGGGRVDDTVAAGLSVRYLINRFMSARIQYQYSQRDSSVDSSIFGQDFTDNTVMFGLRLQR